VAKFGLRLKGGPIRYLFEVMVVSDSDPKGSTGLARRGTLAFLAVARRKKSVGQKMDENQTGFSVRTEIHFFQIRSVRKDGIGIENAAFFLDDKRKKNQNAVCICVFICNYMYFTPKQ
jgi:hypothetical protein